MRKKEFRLRESENIREGDVIKNLEKQMRGGDNQSKSEAIFMKQLILLPEGTSIEESFNLIINPISKQDIKPKKQTRKKNYIDELPVKELRDCLRKNQLQYNLGQQELQTILRKFTKETKERSKKEIEYNEMDLLQSVTENVRVESYIKKISYYCDKLIDHLHIKDSEVLQPTDKEVIIEKLDLLQSHLDHYRKTL